MAVVVTDPFGIPAPDGQRYFKVLGPPRGLISGYRMILDAIKVYEQAARRATDPQIRAQNLERAHRLDIAFKKLHDDMRGLGVRTAQFADGQIRDNIDRTQVRPDNGGSRLRDNILSRPIHTSLPAAAVGIADMSVLDKTVSKHSRPVPYWRAQEFGLVVDQERIIPGYFEPGGAAPDPQQFRVHPIFQQYTYGKGMPALLLKAGQRVAAERRFLRDGVAEAAVFRQQELKAIQGNALAALARARGGPIGPRGGLQGGPRRRAPRPPRRS